MIYTNYCVHEQIKIENHCFIKSALNPLYKHNLEFFFVNIEIWKR